MSKVDLSVKIGSLKLKNPVMLASGSLSLKPRKGNPPQRIVETPAGMLNAIGLANVGVEAFIKNKIPFLKQYDVPLICNIAASTVEEYVECVKILKDEEVIKAFEINVSCPNVNEGGLIFGNDVKSVARITELVRSETTKPLIIKLSPNVSKISDFAKAAKEGGADAVSAINTIVGTSFNINTRKPKIHNITGGLSGPAIKPIALAKVLEISRSVDIPIIGIGGIMDWKDVVEFIIAGASAIQIGTLNFIDPSASGKIINKLTDLTASYNLD
jgi:dihydroorotate dehydrogenase (NAD+) catalytic subunit